MDFYYFWTKKSPSSSTNLWLSTFGGITRSLFVTFSRDFVTSKSLFLIRAIISNTIGIILFTGIFHHIQRLVTSYLKRIMIGNRLRFPPLLFCFSPLLLFHSYIISKPWHSRTAVNLLSGQRCRFIKNGLYRVLSYDEAKTSRQSDGFIQSSLEAKSFFNASRLIADSLRKDTTFIGRGLQTLSIHTTDMWSDTNESDKVDLRWYHQIDGL